ncbi:hypothetical protein GQ457_02G024510 [Hibiscus cannabinus]
MLDRLVGKQFYCFLDGYSGYNQIAIAPEDQSKTTFTCPYGTFAFRRMPFGLCNAPATFQRCMTAIFSDLNKDCLEIFMDDFSTFGDNFDNCLSNLEKVLKRCNETNLVLNWEKCHFMVDEGTMLGHKISSKGMEVDKAKIEVISKLPPPTTVKGIRSFLGHPGFYRRFIADFSKITKPLCSLLEQGRQFEFNEDCTKAFNLLKQKLVTTPIVEPPDWKLPFELMCDASDYAVGAVLGQRKGKIFHPIYYASKTLNDAQVNYTTTEKEMLAVIFAFDKFRSYLIGTKNHDATLKSLETQVGQISQILSSRPIGGFPSDTEVAKGATHEQCNAIITRSGKILKNNQGGMVANSSPTIDTPAKADEPAQAIESSLAESSKPEEIRPPPHFPQRLKKQKQDYQFKKFLDILKQVHINLPLVEALQQMPNYAKFLKDMVTRKKRIEEFETAAATEICLALMHNKVPPKKTDPGSFTIECFIGHNYPTKALCDPGASINLMPKSVFQKLGIDKSSIEQPPKLELKQLPEQLKYAYLGENETLSVIISSKLQAAQEERLIATLRQHKEALGWTIAEIKGISPSICMHKILLEDDHKPTVDAQRRLNQAMKDVVRKEILKWLDACIIYPISDSEWVSPVQCVPKKGGISVISNEKNELIPTRTVTSLRVCMDYRKLNIATRKDHFPLPFIDQMLDRLAGKQFYCFLDGYSGYNQIAIAPEDQSKTTFTFPYGTFDFRRMPFGLCNAPATFQRCMTAIFSDLNEDCLEIFMDDFSTFGDNFDNCMSNLEKVLKRCNETNLVLNWEKCHFMVDEGTMLGHKISSKGMKVDKAKIEVISKLPPPTTVNGIRSFLGHPGFYRRFIADFSKITKPLCSLLEQRRQFEFNEDCTKAFNLLKQKLVTAPIVEPPDWKLPFELMCDASDYAVGAVLGQRKGNIFHPIYYASKTLNDAQVNYTTTEKEMLAVIFAFDKFRSYLIGTKVTVHTDHSAIKYLLSKKMQNPG